MVKFKKEYYNKADIVLLTMPGTPVERPSLGLSLLKASLEKTPFSADILYANIFFEKEIEKYYNLWHNTGLAYKQFHEWTFSKILFPNSKIKRDEYLKLLAQSLLPNVHNTEENSRKLINIFKEIQTYTEPFIDSLADLIIEKRPRIVGCSSVFFQHISSLSILKKIKEKQPEIITIIGGPNCYGEMGLTTAKMFPFVDYVFLGEADEIFPEFVNQVFNKANKDEWELPNSIINHERAIKLTGLTNACNNIPHEHINNLNNLPLPDFSDYFIARDNYSQTPLLKSLKSRVIQIEASRGCWWFEKVGCTFCGLNNAEKKYRSKSTEKVIDEITKLNRLYKPSLFMFSDNVINMSSFDEFTTYLSKVKQDYNLFFEIKSNLSKKQVKALADANIKHVQAGIESLHDNILKLMRKGTTVMNNIQLLKYAAEFGVYVTWNLLLNFPGEEKQWNIEMNSRIKLLTHLMPPSAPIMVRFQRFSEYFENPEKYNLHLIPDRYYKYVYPFDNKILENLVYYFEDNEHQNKWGGTDYDDIKKAINDWYKEYLNKDGRAVLQMKIKNEEILITDTRKCAKNKHHVLNASSALLYKNCDSAVTKKQLYHKLKYKMTNKKIDGILKNLVSKRLIINIKEKYLSLAILVSD